MFILGWGHSAKFKDRGFWGLLALTVSTVPILASSGKLKLARFSAKLIFQGENKCGKKMCSDFHIKVGILHMKFCSDVHTMMGTLNIKICSDVQNRVGDTAHKNVFRCSK